MSSPSAEEQFSKRVWTTLKVVTSPICSGGRLELESPPTISLKKKDNASFTIEPAQEPKGMYNSNKAKAMQLESQVEGLKGLVNQLPQASFGHGQETVCNKDITDALQLQADDFDVNIPDEKLEQILAKVKDDLHLQTDIKVELYSLNVYQKGGRFVKHKVPMYSEGRGESKKEAKPAKKAKAAA